MKVAVVGSRNCRPSDYRILEKYIPGNVSEIVSGGASGIDTLAKRYAELHRIRLTEFVPDYHNKNISPRSAPIIRNKKIVEYSDLVLAFWDGVSRGTSHTIEFCIQSGVPVKVFILQREREKLLEEFDGSRLTDIVITDLL